MRPTALKHHRPTPSLLIALVALLSALTLAGPAPARTGGGLPPPFGKLCGRVGGEAWHYKGQRGTKYNVTATSGACRVATRSVRSLTKHTPHAGAVGPNTLAGPRGFRCVGTGSASPGLKPAQSGTCQNGGKHFQWAPRLK